jgi:uncharacterized membrane protein
LKGKPVSSHFRTSLKFYDNIKIDAYSYNNNFVIENFEYKASAYDEILNRLKKGDTVQIWADNNKNSDGNILVYGLRYNDVDYINIEERNAIKARYNKYGLIVALYGIFLLFTLYLKRGVKFTFTKAVTILLLILIGIYRITK